MSGPAIIPIIKFVSTAMSVKTAMDGIREGNLMKAAIGAAGAYVGLSSFASSAGTTAASETTKAAATEGSKSMVSGGMSAAEFAAADAAGQAAAGVGSSQITSNLVASGTDQAMATAATNAAQTGTTMAAQGASKGIIGGTMGAAKNGASMAWDATKATGGFIRDNSEILAGVGQGYLTWKGQEEAREQNERLMTNQERQREYERDQEQRSLARRSAVADMRSPRLSKIYGEQYQGV